MLGLILCILVLPKCVSKRVPVSLRTVSSPVKGVSGKTLHTFLSTAQNWPRIVLSSCSVSGDGIEEPARSGGKVQEIFGVPPLLPLVVEWTCEAAIYPIISMKSPSGVPGIAESCSMNFFVTETSEGAQVELEMVYTPQSPLAYAAIPILALDNSLALQVLMPSVLYSDVFIRGKGKNLWNQNTKHSIKHILILDYLSS